MDQQQAEGKATGTAEKTGNAARDAAARAGASVQAKLDQGKAMVQDMQASAGETLQKATTMARQASDAGRQAMSQASEVIQGAAREAGNQASQVATQLYQQGTVAGGYLSRYTAEQPLTALLIAGAIGYGLAYLIHRS